MKIGAHVILTHTDARKLTSILRKVSRTPISEYQGYECAYCGGTSNAFSGTVNHTVSCDLLDMLDMLEKQQV